MTKFVKMSLAAAVAVAGISTTASAMENTTFSGKLYVENIYKSTETTPAGGTSSETGTTGFDIDFDLAAKAKITDNLTGVARVQADAETYDNDTTTSITKDDHDDDDTTADTVDETTSNSGASASEVNLDNAYFTYANMGASVSMGRQDINTPNTDGEIGEGLFATYTAGPVTIAAAGYNTNEIVAGEFIHAVAALGSAGPINFEAWNVVIAGETASSTTNNTLVLGGEFGPISASYRHATTEYDKTGSTTKDGETNIVTVSANVGKIGLTGIVITTDEDGAALVTDASSANTIELASFSAKGLSDVTGYGLVASMPVSDAGTVVLKYATADFANTKTKDEDANEYVLQYNHKLAKSTTMSVRYAGYSDTQWDTDDSQYVDTDKTHARVDVTYKF